MTFYDILKFLALFVVVAVTTVLCIFGFALYVDQTFDIHGAAQSCPEGSRASIDLFATSSDDVECLQIVTPVP